MSPMFIITPIIGWSWPALTPIIAAAAGLLGYSQLTKEESMLLRGKLTRKLKEIRMVELPLHQYLKDLIAEEVEREERLDFRKGDILLTFRKDGRGNLFVEVMAPRTITLAQLRRMGEEFALQVIQQFSHHRIASELDRLGVQIVTEEVNAEGDIILRTRKWE